MGVEARTAAKFPIFFFFSMLDGLEAMAMTVENEIEAHDAKCKLVTGAIVELWQRLAVRGMQPECMFEGAVRGAGVVLLSVGTRPCDVADLLSDMANGFRDLAPPKLRVIEGGAGNG